MMSANDCQNDKARWGAGSEVTANNTANGVSQNQPLVGNPRERRLLARLLSGPCDREPLDRVIGASNSPDIVSRLRARGFALPCERIKGTDRDGCQVRWGRYSLTDADRELCSRVVPALGDAHG